MTELLTTRELQDLLKIDRTTVYRMLNDGRLTGVKVGGQWRFPRRELETLLEGKGVSDGRNGKINPSPLPIACVQAVQDVFAEVAEVGAVTTSPDGEPLTEISNICGFCALIMNTESGRQACVASWQKLARLPEHRTQFVACHAGLKYARARIEVEGSLTATLVAGQFHAEPPVPEEQTANVHRLAAAHGLDEPALLAAAQEVPVLSSKRQDRIGHWLETVAGTFEEIGRERLEMMRRLRSIAEISALETV
jgi:excisionase family DNA binding protein